MDGLAAEAEANIQNYLFGVQFKDNAIDGPTVRFFLLFLRPSRGSVSSSP